MFNLLAYLNPSATTVGPIEWALSAVVAILVLLAIVYVLTRFIAWAARR